MIKLYKNRDGKKSYWEAWENGNGDFTIHWGELGERGKSEVVKSSLFRAVNKKIDREIEAKRLEGYQELDSGAEYTLLIEYTVDGFGNEKDLDKRHSLEDRMNETLGWTGLGHCDGGSIGSGTMEVCCFVVDFELAKKVIENDLSGSEFADYARIYDENA
jgi:predicted DNA-binding WGR domain protein